MEGRGKDNSFLKTNTHTHTPPLVLWLLNTTSFRPSVVCSLALPSHLPLRLRLYFHCHRAQISRFPLTFVRPSFDSLSA